MAYNRHNAPPMLSRYKIDANGCWIYTGQKGTWGYGVVAVGQYRDGNRRRYVAHRYFYEQLVGPIPDGLILCHKCDVPACVNPDHMHVGTQKDNIQDMHRKGRYHHAAARGVRNAHAKLTEEDVINIRKRIFTAAQEAKKYGVAESTISHIRTGRSWRHI